MHIIKVVNLKCGGCETGAKLALEKVGLKKVVIDAQNQKVSFEGDIKIAEKALIRLGYPPADSPAAKSIVKKAKSYVSCLIGKSKK